MPKSSVFNVRGQPGFTAIAFVCFTALYLPIILLVIYSFNAGSSIAIWEGFSLQWYESAWANKEIQDATIRSLILASCASVIATFAAVAAALATTRTAAFRGSSAVFAIINQPLMVPEIVTAVALLLFFAIIKVATGYTGMWYLTNLLIRTFAIMEIIRNEGVINTLLLKAGLIEAPIQLLYTEFAIMLGMIYVYLPLMVLPIYASMERLDFSLVEAAYDLYGSRFRVLKRVILPLVKPGIIAGSILVFVPSLGAYVTPRVLGGGKQLMIGNLIELQFGQGRNWPLGAALSITLLAIVMIALMFYVRAAKLDDHQHA